MTTSLQRNFVLFLGAGFSVDAGLPIMSSFGSESLTDYKTLVKIDRYAVPLLVEAANKYYAFQELCKKSPTISSEDANNFETIFCIVEAMIEAGIETIPLQGMEYPLEKLNEQLQLWLWKIYQQSPTTNPNRKTHEATYKDFFSRLHNSKLWDRTIIISTNYDLMFEYFSWETNSKQACTYYPMDEYKPITISDGKDRFVYCNQDANERCIPVCKLHGSINFFENKSSTNDDLYVTTDIGGRTDIGKSGKFVNWPAIFAVDAIWKIRKDYGQTLTPAIIPPTYAKLAQKKWQRSIWEFAFKALCEANDILFIGYSMPKTDGFMRALIDGAFTLRNERRPPNVFVIDPDQEVHTNYSTLFGDCYHDVGQHTLADALKKMYLKSLQVNKNNLDSHFRGNNLS